MDKHELISGLLNTFTRAASEALSENGPEDIHLDWSLATAPQEGAETWTWWSAGLSTHPGANFFIGAPEETWEKLGRAGNSENNQENAFAMVNGCFSKAIEERFGSLAAVQDSGPSSVPSEDWTLVTIEIRYPAGQWPNACCVLSPEFEEALSGSSAKLDPVAAPVPSPPTRTSQSDMLMHVQVPVSVSFGATQIRMQDLLNLTAGSVVELDQALHDNVEVRVNDRVIARGEVVAVDGHYGVRVLELVSVESPGRGNRV
jgi:flagellar motor switch protein FliN/FliY